MKTFDLSRLHFLKPFVAGPLLWVNLGIIVASRVLLMEIGFQYEKGEIFFVAQILVFYGLFAYEFLTLWRVLQTQFLYRAADIWFSLIIGLYFFNCVWDIWAIIGSPVFVEWINFGFSSAITLFSTGLMIALMRMPNDLYGKKWHFTILTLMLYGMAFLWNLLHRFDFVPYYEWSGILDRAYETSIYLLFLFYTIFLFQIFRRAHQSWNEEYVDPTDRLISQIGERSESGESNPSE